MDLIWPVKDTVSIEIPITVAEYGLPDGTATNTIPIEFLLLKRRDMKAVLNEREYLKKFVSPIKAKHLNDEAGQNSFIALTESEEVANYIIDSQVGDILNKMGEGNLLELHITD